MGHADKELRGSTHVRMNCVKFLGKNADENTNTSTDIPHATYNWKSIDRINIINKKRLQP